jgi:hypothetical protein
MRVGEARAVIAPPKSSLEVMVVVGRKEPAQETATYILTSTFGVRLGAVGRLRARHIRLIMRHGLQSEMIIIIYNLVAL